MNKLAVVFLVLGLAACSTSDLPQEPAQPDEPIPPLELASCLFVNVLAPRAVPEGEGFTAEVRMHNFCVGNVTVPIMTPVTSDGEPTTNPGFPFYLMITDPSENDNGVYPVRWTSRREDAAPRLKIEMVELIPYRALAQKITWDGRLEDGKILKKGEYMVFGAYPYAPYGPKDMRFVEIWSIKPFKITRQ